MTTGVAEESSVPGATAPRGYSRAFEALTQGNQNDVVGMLAYALYKRSIAEAVAEGGEAIPSTKRNPRPTEIEAYRGQAERILQKFADQAILDAAPEILQSRILEEIRLLRSEHVVNAEKAQRTVETKCGEVQAHVTSRTNWLGGFFVNVGAWIFSLFLTWIIVASLGLPSPLQALGLLSPPTQARTPNN